MQVADDFLITFKYQNSLPNAPSGPFLKKINILNSFDEFPNFQTSTLEKGYVWQPHFGNDCGVKLDLVDQDVILGSHDKCAQSLDQADLRYLAGSVDKSRGKMKQIDQQSKPWWLRNTTYLENNLFNTAKTKAMAVDVAAKQIEAKRASIDSSKYDLLSTEFINNSFEVVSRTVESLVEKNNKLKLRKVMPLVPLDPPLQETPFSDKFHSLVRFDEEVGTSNMPNGTSVNPISNGSNTMKRKRDCEGIITNLRQSTKHSDIVKSQALLEVSLVSPVQDDNADTGSKYDDNYKKNTSKFDWIKDFRMDVQHITQCDSFIFVYPSKETALTESLSTSISSDSINNTEDEEQQWSVQYFPIRARMDMKKMNPEDSLPHDCIVTRIMT